MMVGMSFVFSHPFRVAGGYIAVVDPDSDAGHAQEIAVLCSTVKGERVLVPDYGVSEMVGAGVDLAEVNAGLAVYGPEGLSVTGADISYPDETTQVATLTFGTET